MTVAENLQMGADATPGSKAERAASQERVLRLFPRLQERMSQRGGTLSGNVSCNSSGGASSISGRRRSATRASTSPTPVSN